MSVLAVPVQPRPVAAQAMGIGRIFLVTYCCALLYALVTHLPGRPFSIDVDDQMRALQIRYLVQAPVQRWWDLSLPAIRMPELYLSPWSRLVDLPYLLIHACLQPWFGSERALSLAFLLWPPLVLSVFCALLATVLRGMVFTISAFDHLLLIATVSIMLFAIGEFAPGRIDHHNMQFVALMAIAAGIMKWDRSGGMLAGFGCVASVAIGLEGVPLIVAAFAGLAVAALARAEGQASC